MARISQTLNSFSEDVFESYGFGNQTLSAIFLLATLLSLAALTGMYFPALAASMSGLISLSLGGSVFLGISLLSGLNIGGIVFGLIAGILLASISTTICSLALFLAPPIAALLLIPNIIAAAGFVLGGICSVVESCFGYSGNSEYHQPSYLPYPGNLHSHQSYPEPAPNYQAPRGNAYFEVPPYGSRLVGRDQPPSYVPPSHGFVY